MHAATTPTLPQSSSLAQRIAFPSPSAAQARVDLHRQLQIKRARADMQKRQQRLAALVANSHEMQELRSQAESIVADPILDAAWPVDCEELADKIQRESWGLLRSSESPVRNADRKLITDKLPPCVQVAQDDVRYTK